MLGAPLVGAPSALAADATTPLVVGSKRFTESYVLGEILAQTLGRRRSARACTSPGLGNTGILEQALASGAVDLYPEYTGTIVRELLKRDGNPSLDELNRWLAPRGLKAAVPLGFNNTYALAMTRAEGRVARHPPHLRPVQAGRPARSRSACRTSSCERADGWPALRKAYGARAGAPIGLDHGLAYDAVAAGRVDVIDVYSTDAKLGRLGLTVLDDDLGFFPKYDAVVLMRADVDAGAAGAARRLDRRGDDDRDERRGRARRAQLRRDGAEVPRRRLRGGVGRERRGRRVGERCRRRARERRGTRGGAAAGQPRRARLRARLRPPRRRAPAPRASPRSRSPSPSAFRSASPPGAGRAASRSLLGAVALLQTIPSLALLAFLIALVGAIGVVPAVLALFLYALLPIVRNTHAGLQSVSGGMAQAALSLGMTARQALRHVQLPLAAPTLLAGVKTAAVINVGTATMAAFIGAGGFGERIVAGLAVNDSRVMLAGALPAAALALLVQGAFDLAERWCAARSRRAEAVLARSGARAPRCDNRGMHFRLAGPGASRTSRRHHFLDRAAPAAASIASARAPRRASCATRSRAALRERARSSARRSRDFQQHAAGAAGRHGAHAERADRQLQPPARGDAAASRRVAGASHAAQVEQARARARGARRDAQRARRCARPRR